ncbi:MAG: excinuclease ABC subunit UvrA [Desulfobulbaceae bacterium]|nr:excinuclease ABC subunit UvrA [Desulfobulbaceae bacterium]
MPDEFIHIRSAHQNNLKNISLDIPLNKMTVVTGVSGSGKSSLAFDTVFAEGQRRYVETFSSYARQFLDRMDKPRVERIDSIPPAVAIDQTNPVRTSRSTVGTMTEINDHLKLLYGGASELFCSQCHRPVNQDVPETIYAQLAADLDTSQPLLLFITFQVTVPENFSEKEVREYLNRQGYIRVHQRVGNELEVIQDRVGLQEKNRTRIVDGLEAAFKYGHGRLTVRPFTKNKEPLAEHHFSKELHCAHCDINFQAPSGNLFSFNSPLGACDTCRGFGRMIGVDYGLVVPNEGLSLSQGAIKPWQTDSYLECQNDLLHFAARAKIPVDIPWRDLSDAQREWVLEGEGEHDEGLWYGVSRFFHWLETKSYKMHIRVLLSKYRAYHLCPACKGARLKPESLLWKLGGEEGLAIHELTQLPIDDCLDYFHSFTPNRGLDEATQQLLGEIQSRLKYLCEVGLGYLTLDRQSRTLSGGEIQRVNLTSALGASLVNTLFVLDEPSIGLHPKDIKRLISILQRLRDSGNTLLIVEHDPEVMMAADMVVDMGPGPGERGGKIVFSGNMNELLSDQRSLTAQYLKGTKQVAISKDNLAVTDLTPRMEILGAAAHNLKNIDFRIPQHRLVCLTGVSGSGKSTLLEDVLYRGLCKRLGKPVEQPGAHDEMKGFADIQEVVLVDQSSIGKTARSNPVSYVGGFDPIRKLFAATPFSKERGYTASTFSFNTGKGRCPECSGTGFEHVEMQFLSDVYLRCPNCDGKRFRPEVLEVTIASPMGDEEAEPVEHSIAGVLAMTVNEACDFFSQHPKVLKALKPLQDVGLGYLRLGQPLPTLSGGEAQRLKLAGHLAKWSGGKKKQQHKTLFLFDEPTTGLHFADIAVLLVALRKLLQHGHSLLVIEHNLDVIRAADWIIDLGPEGGEQGGQIVAQGTPYQLARENKSHTCRALAEFDRAGHQLLPPVEPFPLALAAEPSTPYSSPDIIIRHAREHNLKNIDLRIPLDGFTVITGVSGSGKSTVAFDILFAEGQRRYLETLNAYARQFVQPPPRPDVDAVLGVPPTVAIEQRTSRGGQKSTVATVTELYSFLRLLFTKLATQYCPECNIPITPQSPEMIMDEIWHRYQGQTVCIMAPLVSGRKGYYKDLAEWAVNKGFNNLILNGELQPTHKWPRLDRYKEHTIELPLGPHEVTTENKDDLANSLKIGLEYGKGVVSVVALNISQDYRGQGILFSTHRSCTGCGMSFPEPDPRLFSYNSKRGWCPDCYGTGLVLPDFDEEQSGEENHWKEWTEDQEQVCPSCDGSRLCPEALGMRWQDRSIAQFTEMTVAKAQSFFSKLTLTGREAEIGHDIVAELLSRLGFLRQVGMGYLALNRSAPTLSGGEAQRIRLAAQLGSNLRGVCYILDEPTIGLHPRDTIMLLDILHRLRAKGNSVVVVEHDEETIKSADQVIDLGPGGGINGGKVVAVGPVEDLVRNPTSITGQCLRSPMKHPLRGKRRPVYSTTDHLLIKKANLHNLKDVEVKFPLARLICVTGVSGSGKSTLVRKILYNNLHRLTAKGAGRDNNIPQIMGCKSIEGWEKIAGVKEVDQRPIGRTPRSCPATYIKFWDLIRKLFAETVEARMRGYTPRRFSFNTKEGSCPECKGQGLKKVGMSFLPDVTVECETCKGARFTKETLDVLYKGKNIGEVLNMSIDEAVEFFAHHKNLNHSLTLLRDVGLGYLTLGQQSPTLSGGEAQRIKLVAELARVKPVKERPTRKNITPPHYLYVLDEPTIGLHMADVEKLIRVLHRLVNNGNTVVVIEHNLDVMAEADWLIDLGPEGGTGGGRVTVQGKPEKVAKEEDLSHTAVFLSEILDR